MSESLARVLKVEPSQREFLKSIIEACSDAKGMDISVLDVKGIFDLADYLVIVSGRSDRQVQGISNRVLMAMEKAGLEPLSLEGYDAAHWVLIDLGDVIIHVFYEPTREHYDLESLWANAKKVTLDTLGVDVGPETRAA